MCLCTLGTLPVSLFLHKGVGPMKVLLTSGTGYIGAAVARALKESAHDVAAIAHSPASSSKLGLAGIDAVDGDIRNPQHIAEVATTYDAVIHTAFAYDDDVAQVETKLATTLVESMAATGKRLIYTSGVWVYGSVSGSQAITEDAALIPAPLVAWRPAVENIYLGGAAKGISTSVIRPAMVFGGESGVIGDMFKYAAKHGVVRYVGTGTNLWSLVHVEDLATLYVKVLKHAEPGTVYNGSAGEAMTVHDIAIIVAERAGLASRVKSWPLNEAQKVLGLYADALTRSVVVSSAKAQRELQWKPISKQLSDAYPQQRAVATAQ